MTSIETILNSPCGKLNEHLRKKPVKKIVKARNDCPEVQWIAWNLKYYCEEKGIRLEKEFRFSKRKFCFDGDFEAVRQSKTAQLMFITGAFFAKGIRN